MHFHFRLMPVDEIPPWGEEQGQPTLSWFGLTLGYFWIEVGGQELFRYRAEMLDHWRFLYPASRAPSLPYEDYQVARYWEDLLEMLPDILDPIPADLAARVADAGEWHRWQKSALRWKEDNKDEDAGDVYHTALSWWGHRTWGASHLAHPPNLWLWRVEDMVHVRWDNRDITEDGLLMWEAQQEEFTLPVSEFLAEVESFHVRFLGEMGQRVDSIRTTWSRPKVQIDLEALARAQSEHFTCLEAAIRPWVAEVRRSNPWEEVREAMATIS